MLVDTHAHLNFKDYEKDLDGVLQRAKKNGVGNIICASSNLADSEKAVILAQKYPGVVYASVGIHPQQTDPENGQTIEEQLERLEELTGQNGVAAIGECGLDFSVPPPPEKERSKADQKILFKRQIEIALKHNLPIIVHSRKSFDETIEILSAYKSRGVIHCYSGGKRGIQKVLDLGYFFGIDGNVTYDAGLQEVSRLIPLDNILLETDSPFMAPVPYRKKRNEPAYLAIIAKALARIKEVPFSGLAKITFSNSQKLFKLD